MSVTSFSGSFPSVQTCCDSFCSGSNYRFYLPIVIMTVDSGLPDKSTWLTPKLDEGMTQVGAFVTAIIAVVTVFFVLRAFQKFVKSFHLSKEEILLATSLGATSLYIAGQPAFADDDAITQINGLVTNIKAIATGAIVVVLGVIALRVGVKTFNRVFTKN